ncbi:unnamed protein product [Miscanthus lutarioriparius]|uniref:Uncharacterized protein n=1 Tax=Miscanthus lutarioriparius TaxID=422564 RepID=A0A811N133_9POAL|nr:unnamed protein product [Miscanthus lutarioriparius]
MVPSQEEAMIMKEKGEATTSTEEVAAPAPEESESNVLSQGVIELSNDEPEDLIASIAVAASTGPSKARPSTPRVAIMPDTSDDWEFARKLFVELNREAIGIPGDGALVDLVSDNEDTMEADAGKAKKEVAPDGEGEEGDATADDRLPEQTAVPPSPLPST